MKVKISLIVNGLQNFLKEMRQKWNTDNMKVKISLIVNGLQNLLKEMRQKWNTENMKVNLYSTKKKKKVKV